METRGAKASRVPIIQFRATDFDDLDLTSGKEYPLHTFRWPVRPAPLPYDTIGPATDPPPPPWDLPEGNIKVKISASLDVFGDGSCIIKRELEDSVWLYIHM